jgi:hypothetical protein
VRVDKQHEDENPEINALKNQVLDMIIESYPASGKGKAALSEHHSTNGEIDHKAAVAARWKDKK